MESGGQVFVAEVGHALQNRLGELRADHRRGLEQPLRPLGEAVDPCCEHVLHGRGQANFFRGRDQAIRTPCSRDNTRLDQGLDDLFDKEGISARAGADELVESEERRIASEKIGEELLDRL